MTVLSTPPRVLIIGGGLGGLALANGLARQNIGFKLFERDATPTDRLQGFRIVLRNDPKKGPMSVDALRELLTREGFEKIYEMSGEGGAASTTMNAQLTIQHKMVLPGGGGISIGRMALRDILLEGLPSQAVYFGKKFTSYSRNGENGTIVAHFSDGSQEEGTLLVAADGGNSRIRRQFFSELARPDPRIITHVSGVVAKIPVTPGSVAEQLIGETHLDEGMILASAPGRSFYAARLILPAATERLEEDFAWSRHRSYIYWVLNTSAQDVAGYLASVDTPTPYDLTGAQLLTHATRLLKDGGFHESILKMVEQSHPDTAVWLDFNSGERCEWASDSQVTFVGDSIHGMTPYLGAGALVAIGDGWELAKALGEAGRGEKSLREAVEGYEGEMRNRAYPIMEGALKRMRGLTAKPEGA